MTGIMAQTPEAAPKSKMHNHLHFAIELRRKALPAVSALFTITGMSKIYPGLRFLSAEGIIGLLAVIVATTAELDWVFRSIAVAAGLALWGHLIFRSDRHIVARLTLFAMGAVALLAVTWHPIWEDFHTKHPEIAAATYLRILADKGAIAADFVKQPVIFWPLAAAALLILIWGTQPVWSLRHRLRFTWRTFLGEETWISREDAIKLVRASDWAKTREPHYSIIEQVARLGGGTGVSPYERDMLLFKRVINMTLESFERQNSHAVREQENKKQYAQGVLTMFLASALDTEAIQKFGPVP